MSTLILTVREALRYRGKEGQLAWIGHRLAGMGTVLFFTTHVIDTSWVYFWPEGYGHAIRLYQSLPFQIGELLLVLAVIYHGVNGLRLAVMDWKPSLWKHQRTLTLAAFVVTAVLYLPALVIMGSHALENLFGIHIF